MEPYLENLNPEQYQAATTVDGPLVIIAGAGSGKTTTMTARMCHMLSLGISPSSILMLTFTNAAATAMKEKAEKMAGEAASGIMACTYHSFCAAMLREYGKMAGMDPGFTIISQGDVNQAIGLVKAKAGDKYKIKGFPSDSEIAGMISLSSNTFATIPQVIDERYRRYSVYADAVEEIAAGYRAYKKEKNLADYDDLLIFFSEMMNNPDAGETVGRRFQYIMVDEYQDTNRLQEYILFKMLRFHQNIAVVGDDYQSIYSFRGGNINNILDFGKHFDNCRRIVLDTNYRSTEEILSFANSVMAAHADFGVRKYMKSAGKNGPLPEVIATRSQNDECSMMVDEVKRYLEEGGDPAEFCIIERSSMSSLRIEAELAESGIGYTKRGGLKFFEHRCVMDILAILKSLVNISDELSWFRVLKLVYGVGSGYANMIVEKIPDTVSGYGFLTPKTLSSKKFFGSLVALREHYEKWGCLPDYKTLYGEVEKYYLYLRQDAIDRYVTEDEGKRTTLQNAFEMEKKVLDVLKDIAFSYKSLGKFLDAIVLDEKRGAENTGITISTIHSVKGLEFDRVYLLDAVDGLFPRIMENGPDPEDLRCFYVAVTRAKTYLTVFVPKYVKIGGHGVFGKGLSFLEGADSYVPINPAVHW